MKREPGVGLAIDIPGTLPQRVEDDDDVFGCRLNLLEGLINRKTELVCEAIVDPLRGGGLEWTFQPFCTPTQRIRGGE